ncbi:MAG: D-alanyl-D-alanine carboxypeptidase family protein [Actinomycetota bacterium]
MARLRGRGLLVGAILGAAAIVVLVRLLPGGDGVIRPDHPCADPPPLITYKGVTLQPIAMRAFKRALRLSEAPIIVVQSYRSCHQQALACRNVCGDASGCPGRCAKPGTSYHQIGAALDITQGSLDSAGVVTALEGSGWCQSEPSSDPGHFSFGGCH